VTALQAKSWAVFKLREALARKCRSAKLRTAVLAGALASLAMMTASNSAQAEGFLDFLLGSFPHQPSPPSESYPPPPSSATGRVAPTPLGPEKVIEDAGSPGHAVAFCVRLCDGQHFPMEHMVNGTPVETCRAICPYSETKVFFGSEVGEAIARDGGHYSSLNTAFLYRKKLVPNCTCNGRSAFGLSVLDVHNDPTLRPGDIVSTKDGLMAYTGHSASRGGFMPVNPASLPDDIRPQASRL